MSIDYLQEKVVTIVSYSRRLPNGLSESDGIPAAGVSDVRRSRRGIRRRRGEATTRHAEGRMNKPTEEETR